MATKTEVKQKAQEMLMHGMGNVLGYWTEAGIKEHEDLGITEDELQAELEKQADRVARMFGYEQAWGS